MARVHVVRQRTDNFCYITDDGVIVDVPDGKQTLEFLEHTGIVPKVLLVTHGHADHIAGVPQLQERFPGLKTYAPYAVAVQLGAAKVEGDDEVEGFKVFHVPGHTNQDVCYYRDKQLFVGDVLFDCGCGRLFEGDAETFYNALVSMMSELPEATELFIGHDYSLSNIKFAKSVDPQNLALANREDEVQLDGAVNSPVLLVDQLQINPFLRASDPQIRANIGMRDAADAEVFAELRRRKDKF